MFWRSQQQKQLYVLFFSFAAYAENLGGEVCDQNNSRCRDSQVLLQMPPPSSPKEDRAWKVLERVGFCRSPNYLEKWFGKVDTVGNRNVGECFAACTEGRENETQSFHSFSNDGVYSYCYCNYECKCLAAAGLSSTIVRADFRGPLPGPCTDCPKIHGTFSYKGPSTDPEGFVEIQQHKCLGVVAGRGRFTTARSNSGVGRIGIRTVYGLMEAHGLIKGKQGSQVVNFDNGYTYTQTSENCKCTNGTVMCRCGQEDDDRAPPNGWESLGRTAQVTCAGGARVFKRTRLPSMLGGFGKSSFTECADYATRNHAFYFAFANCPPPQVKYTLEAQQCAGGRCIRGGKGKGFLTFPEAWQACGLVENCSVIMRWRNGRYYLRRSTDPIYQRRRAIKKTVISMPYFCQEERNRCDIWNSCSNIQQNKKFLAFQKACPTAKEICEDQTAECSVGCECPMCESWGAMPLS